MDFQELVTTIKEAHTHLSKSVGKTIDKGVTLRNWLIGMYIKEYELKGKDRAEYGEKLLRKLAEGLQVVKVPGCSYRNLQLFRQFYQEYVGIGQTLSAQFRLVLSKEVVKQIVQTVSAQLPETSSDVLVGVEDLINHLSFSHLVELMKVDVGFKRGFYEHECIRCNWGVRELKRQINSLYFERTGLSKNKAKLAEIVKSKSASKDAVDQIRDPYVFEFLGLKPKEIVMENNLRDALIEKLQDFLLELGKGFCFEAKNKKILIGDTYYYIDLVLYHRFLKCSVILELLCCAQHNSSYVVFMVMCPKAPCPH